VYPPSFSAAMAGKVLFGERLQCEVHLDEPIQSADQ
jgi:hypothetical protein